jgi:predicted O-linked N-acetylglucosamine transferase (SPINDLY family)
MNTKTQLDQARELHRQGNLAMAEEFYFQILQADPVCFGAYLLLGTLRSQQGRIAEAISLIGKSLQICPNDFEALSIYGPLLMAGGRFADALEIFDRALAIRPGIPQGLYNRGLALANLNRFEAALASYDNAISRQPDFAFAWINRGIALGKLGRFDEAIESYDRALALQPQLPQALENRGASLLSLGRVEEALANYDKVLAIEPGNAAVWNVRGVALHALVQFESALEAFERAVALRPNFIDAFRNRGDVLRNLRRFDEALTSYDRAIALDPGNAAIWNERGVLLGEMNRLEDALASYDKALALKPDYANALINRGSLQWSRMGRRYDEATKDLERALALDPQHAYARGELLHIRMQAADWRDFPREKAQIDQDIREGHLVIQPFVYQAISDSAADLAACSRRFAKLYPAVPCPPVPRSRNHAKIRIGYLSADFREQATAYLTVGLYEMHDRQRFEIIAFDNGASDDSAIRARLEKAFDKIVAIAHLPDHVAADRIRAEEIDILVNLNGYFGSHRMGVFARKPAPVQVNFLGFPATLGAPYMDYILADRVVIPEEERCHYSEQVVHLPDCYQVNDSRRPIAEDIPTRAGNGLPEQAFIFCNFNQSYKFTPAMFESWMRILQQVPDSVLWLLDDIPEFRDNLCRAAQRHDVAGTRLIFAPRVAVEKHLARLRLADLFLDSLPYNAHTTASDALWAGLPLLTCRGTAFPGRVAASLLGAAGLPELVTETPADYERLAVTLARDTARLGAIRQRLRQNRLDCALFDTDRFRRHIEASYAMMWDIWLRGEKPHAFSA